MARRRRPPPRFEQFFAIRRFQPALSFTPDGRRILFVTNTSGQFNLWRTAATGGRQQQLTAFEENTVRSLAPSPDGKTIAIIADQDGDEFHQIYVLPATGGWPEAWTESPQVQHYIDEHAWSPDGKLIAFGANSRVPTDMDIWVRDVETGDVRQVFGPDKYAFPAFWSPDGRQLSVLDFRNTTDTSVYVVDIATGETREVTPHEEEAQFLPGPWAVDGSGFYVLCDKDREIVGLGFLRLDGELEWIETPDADIEEVALSPGGRVLAWTMNENGWARLRLRDLESGADLPEPQLPQGARSLASSGIALSPDGSRAALIWQGPRHPPDLFVVETETGKARRVTESMLGGLRPRDLVEPEVIGYPTFDGRDIPAWLYRPKRRGRVPAVVSIHGGPEAQERPVYMPLYQYLLSRGIAVLATNIRGSTGYGKSYQKLIHRDWGGGDYKDLMAGVDHVISRGVADPERMGVMGGEVMVSRAMVDLLEAAHH